MSARIIAFPGKDSGLKSELVVHFGHTPIFTTIKFDEQTKEIMEVTTIQNPPHQQGGCMQPVLLLKDAGVTDIVLGGIGVRPLMGFKQMGIKTYHGISGTIEENFQKFLANELQIIEHSTCSGH